jgi:hypothetical protein
MLMAKSNLVGTAGLGHHRAITVEPLIDPGAVSAHEQTTKRAVTCKEVR